jgi:hypothetical protein
VRLVQDQILPFLTSEHFCILHAKAQ